MKINTTVNVALYADTVSIPFDVHTFDNLNDAVAFQQTSIKSNKVAKVQLMLSSEKENEAKNDPA